MFYFISTILFFLFLAVSTILSFMGILSKSSPNALIFLFIALPFAVIAMIGIHKILKAIDDANDFEPVNCPTYLIINPKTGECRFGNKNIWWRVFFNSINGRPL